MYLNRLDDTFDQFWDYTIQVNSIVKTVKAECEERNLKVCCILKILIEDFLSQSNVMMRVETRAIVLKNNGNRRECSCWKKVEPPSRRNNCSV